MLTHCCQVLSFYTLSETWNIIQLDFWWYKNETLRSNMLKKATLKKTEKCVIKDYPYITIVFYLWSFFSFKLFFFPHLIYLPQLIVDKKRISVIFKRKGKEILNWHKNEGFPLVSKGKRVALLHIKSRIYPAYIFMNTVKNVVRNADISTSFYFIKYWALCLSRENINLNWENI